MSTRKPDTKRKALVAPIPSESAFEKAVIAAGLTVATGKTAVDNRYRGQIEGKSANTRFTGSLDMDLAFKLVEARSNRWDFGLGVLPPGKKEFAVWVEPHSASSLGEVKIVLAKLDWLQAKLKQPAFAQLKALTDACREQGHQPFRWMATAHVGIRPGSREANMLAARGMSPPSARVVI
ncbi:hypothetical protein [Acidovorax kalamii]|uniref:hypothetical protein n=1 Tax=Acidovorax kalamii TaxID=2004485 RepID=UPI001054BF3E|nr:hypothetical protein [Acidovorax kalamii]